MKRQLSVAIDIFTMLLFVSLPYLIDLVFAWLLFDPSVSFPNFLYDILQTNIQENPIFAFILFLFSFVLFLMAVYALFIEQDGQDLSVTVDFSYKENKEIIRVSLGLQATIIMFGVLSYFDFDFLWYEALGVGIIRLFPFFMFFIIPLSVALIILLLGVSFWFLTSHKNS